MIKNYIQNSKLISTLIFTLCAWYLCHLGIKLSRAEHFGDGIEYILIAEAVYNHGTPELRSSDIASYRNEVKKYLPWSKQAKFNVCDSLEKFTADAKNKEVLFNCDGFVVSKNKQFYGMHFFTYPLFLAPIKFIMKPFNIHPIRVMFVGNIVFILIVLYFILYFFPFKEWENLVIAGLFFYSAVHFYVIWTHPEVFVACLTFIGFFLYFFKKSYWGIFLCALAATQYQPLSIFILFMVAISAYQEKFKIKALFTLFVASFWVVLPSLFYQYNFGHTNLVNHLGFLDSSYVGSTRIVGFFTDWNQGMILCYPLLLPAYLILYTYGLLSAIRQKNFKPSVYVFIPFVIIATVAVVSSMKNWCHGQAVSNRYVLYIGTLMVCHFIVMFIQFKHIKWIKYLVIVALITQIITIELFGGIFNAGWDGDKHKPTAKFMLNHYPEWYNPDPHIFYQRCIPYESNEVYYKGVVYLNEEKKFRKAIVNVLHLSEVKMGGLSVQQLKKLTANKKNEYGWVYINPSDLEKNLNSSERVQFLNAIQK